MKIRSLLFLIAMLVSASSSAALVSYNYSASDGFDSTIVGTFGWNTSTSPSGSFPGSFPDAGFLSGVVSGGVYDGLAFNFTSALVEISDNIQFNASLLGDELYINPSSTYSGTYLDIIANDSWFSGNAALPVAPLTFSGTLALDLTLDTDATGGGAAYYTLTDISAVPVPPAIWLFGSALAGFVSWSRRRQKA